MASKLLDRVRVKYRNHVARYFPTSDNFQPPSYYEFLLRLCLLPIFLFLTGPFWSKTLKCIRFSAYSRLRHEISLMLAFILKPFGGFLQQMIRDLRNSQQTMSVRRRHPSWNLCSSNPRTIPPNQVSLAKIGIPLSTSCQDHFVMISPLQWRF